MQCVGGLTLGGSGRKGMLTLGRSGQGRVNIGRVEARL